MPDPISLATLPVVGFLFGLFTGLWERGAIIAFGVHVVWTMGFNNGLSFTSFPIQDIMPYWFWPILLMSITGSVMTWWFNWHPILDGVHLSLLYIKKKDDGSWSDIGKVVFKVILVLIWFTGAHVIIELRIPTFPQYAGGIVCSGMIALGWGIFWWLFHTEKAIFGSSIRAKGLSAVSVYVLFASLAHFIYVTAYWISEHYIAPADWFTGLWYLYTSLIIGGALLVIMSLAGYFLVIPNVQAPAYNTLPEPTDEEEMVVAPPSTTPSAGYYTNGNRIGAYVPPWGAK